ncbi:hypothetical protein K504DRAFT_505925 [Pleomassaria siparia CBS 279.74]|uniref:RING-type domain-containing protein n=1 Tax=Pleomassaria siparia CBS 279.74 TaxID=1314801 RepID=A0A6G1JZ24_9PLEO|nr:hypothetical protein K504DRAFT_505925 [Pleomassaria siparia CBS 279.74]
MSIIPFTLSDMLPHTMLELSYLLLDELEDEDCFICKRKYETVDDANDPQEHPEEAVQIEPCNHVVGGDCIQKWINRNPQNPRCPYCSTKYKNVCDDMPEARIVEILTFVSHSWWFQLQSRQPAEIFDLVDDNMVIRLNALNRRLSPTEAFKIWTIFMREVFCRTSHAAFCSCLAIIAVIHCWYWPPLDREPSSEKATEYDQWSRSISMMLFQLHAWLFLVNIITFGLVTTGILWIVLLQSNRIKKLE